MARGDAPGEVTLPTRGELWWCERPEIGPRPVVVLSRDSTIPLLRRVLVAPCSTNVRGIDTEVVLEPGDDPVWQRTAVHLDSVFNASVGYLTDRIGALGGIRMRQICAALEVAVDSVQ